MYCTFWTALNVVTTSVRCAPCRAFEGLIPAVGVLGEAAGIGRFKAKRGITGETDMMLSLLQGSSYVFGFSYCSKANSTCTPLISNVGMP
jgi:hypothetical protein